METQCRELVASPVQNPQRTARAASRLSNICTGISTDVAHQHEDARGHAAEATEESGGDCRCSDCKDAQCAQQMRSKETHEFQHLLHIPERTSLFAPQHTHRVLAVYPVMRRCQPIGRARVPITAPAALLSPIPMRSLLGIREYLDGRNVSCKMAAVYLPNTPLGGAASDKRQDSV
jgi:hypothetical protein